MSNLIVNFFGGPGSGKSTMAASLFSLLKEENLKVELVTEFAKDLTWENNFDVLANQIYVFGVQHQRIFRLLNNTDIIVTDSPFILSVIYDSEKRNSFKTLVLEEFHKLRTYNIFLKRRKQYILHGRTQSEEEAIQKDNEILDLLDDNLIPYEVFDGKISQSDKIVEKIKLLLTKK